jgi:hypothetical protein
MLNAENSIELTEEMEFEIVEQSEMKQVFESWFNEAEYKRWLDNLAAKLNNKNKAVQV